MASKSTGDLAAGTMRPDMLGAAADDVPVSNEITVDVPSDSEAGCPSASNARSHTSEMRTSNAPEHVGASVQLLEPLETELHRAVSRRANAEEFEKLSILSDALIWAQTPDLSGMPPLYLAIYLGYSDVTQILIDTFDKNLSTGGPRGQNVLHIAALRSKDLTNRILTWREHLINMADESGDKPLHYAASVGVDGVTSLLIEKDKKDNVRDQSNNEGMCPIHIAASVGVMEAVHALVGGEDNYPSSCFGIIGRLINNMIRWLFSVGIRRRGQPDRTAQHTATLRDANGRTFLHVAVGNGKKEVVEYVCRSNSPFDGIFNMKDQDGNTALHLAVKTRDTTIFGYLLGNRLVEINLVNNEGYTPLDVASQIKTEQSYASRQNPTEWMIRTLAHSGGHFSAHIRGSSTSETRHNHGEDMARSTESVLVASALIATVTFAAAFTMPGSYKTDGDPKTGTPALGRSYGVKVFLVADILAFFCSVAATYSLAEYGNRGDPLVRCIYARRAVRFFHVALKSVIVAFALGVSVVMWDISILTTVVVGFIAFLLMLYGNEALAHDTRLMWVLWNRFGFSRSWTLHPSTSSRLDWTTWRLRSFSMTLAWNAVKLCSTYILIFVVAYVAQLKQKSG